MGTPVEFFSCPKYLTNFTSNTLNPDWAALLMQSWWGMCSMNIAINVAPGPTPTMLLQCHSFATSCHVTIDLFNSRLSGLLIKVSSSGGQGPSHGWNIFDCSLINVRFSSHSWCSFVWFRRQSAVRENLIWVNIDPFTMFNMSWKR